MKKLSFVGKEQNVYFEKLDNGLEVYIIPKKNSKNYLVEMVSKFGSEVKEFIPMNEKKYIKIPLGTAHFLEHKLFDTEKGDAMFMFDNFGLEANASTNYYLTRYYIVGNNKIKRNLNYFLDVFFKPYFTDEKIDSERGIIGSEIDMYHDEPEWKLYQLQRCSLFHKALRCDISGTRETIKEINATLLNKVYDIFYQPSNVFLVISGKVKVKEVIDIIKNNETLNKRISNYPIKYKVDDEPAIINKEYADDEGFITIPKFSYLFKYDVNDFSFVEPEVFKIYLNIIFYVLFGDGSSFSEKIYEDKISNYFYIDSLFYQNIYCIGISGESEYADIIKDEIDKQLKNPLILKEDFEREIKIRMSIIIRELDNIRDISDNIVRSIIVRGKYLDEKEIIDKLNFTDFEKVLAKIKFDNKAFNIVFPKEKKN